MSAKHSTSCSFCQQKYRVKADLVGKRIQCKKCGKNFRIRTQEQPGPKFDIEKVLGPSGNLTTEELHGFLDPQFQPETNENSNQKTISTLNSPETDDPGFFEEIPQRIGGPVTGAQSLSSDLFARGEFDDSRQNHIRSNTENPSLLKTIGSGLSLYSKIKIIFLCSILVLMFLGIAIFAAVSLFLYGLNGRNSKDISKNQVAQSSKKQQQRPRASSNKKSSESDELVERKFLHRQGRKLTYQITKKISCDDKVMDVTGIIKSLDSGSIKASLGTMINGVFVPHPNWFQIRYQYDLVGKQNLSTEEESKFHQKKTEWVVADPTGARYSHSSVEPADIDPLLLMPIAGIGTEWVGSKTSSKNGFRAEYQVNLPAWFDAPKYPIFSHFGKENSKTIDTPKAKVYIESSLKITKSENGMLTVRKLTTAKSSFRKPNALNGKLETTYQFDINKGLILGGSCQGTGKLKINGVQKPYTVSANWTLQNIQVPKVPEKSKTTAVSRSNGRLVEFSELKLKPKAFTFDRAGNLFVATDKKKIVYLNPSTKTILSEAQSSSGSSFRHATQLILTKDENYLLEVIANGLINVWENRNGKLSKIGSFAEHLGEAILSLDISADQKRVVSLDRASKVRVWNLMERQQLSVLDFEYKHPKFAFFRPDEKIVVFAHSKRWIVDALASSIPSEKSLSQIGFSSKLVISPNKKMLAVCQSDKIQILDSDFKKTHSFSVEDRDLKLVQFSEDGNSLYAVNRNFYQWNLRSDKQTRKILLDSKNDTRKADVSPSGNLVVVQNRYDSGFVVKLPEIDE